MGKRVEDSLNWIAHRELALLAIVSPLLLLSELQPRLAMAALLVVVLLGLVHRLSRGKLAVGAQLDVPVVILAVALLVSVSVSADWSLSFPKFCVIVLSIAVFYALVHNLRTMSQIQIAFWLLALMGAAVAILGLLSTDWFESKIFSSAIYGALPRLIDNVPRSSRGGFHPNEVAGSLIMFAPLYVSLLLASRQQQIDASGASIRPLTGFSKVLLFILRRAAAPLLVVGLALIVSTILLTQSRAALLALAFALLAMAATRRPVILVVLPVALALGLMWMQSLQRESGVGLMASESPLSGVALTGVVTAADSATAAAAQTETTSWLARTEMWANALRACRDYPYTGVGLANFPTVSRANYVYEQVPVRFNMAHAHNVYLQTAMDFGIPGLLAFLWLILYAVLSLRHVLRYSVEEATRWLGTGLLGGLLAYLVFGLLDAVPLGAKPSVALWFIVALAIAMARKLGYQGVRWPISRPVRLSRGHALALALVFLVAVVLIGDVALHTLFLNLGAVRLDQARLEAGLGAEKRGAQLSAAEYALGKSLAYGDSVGARRRLGVLYAASERDEQAILQWEHDGVASRFLRQQGDWSLSKDDLLAAERYYQLAVRLDPASVESYDGLATLYKSQGRPDEALAAYDTALKVAEPVADAAVISWVHYARAELLVQQGRWSEALDDYRAAVRLSEDVAWYRVGLARALYTVEQDLAAAEAQLRAAMELAPTYHSPYTVLSEVYRREERYAEALVAANRACSLAPQDPWALINRGQVYLETKEYESAFQDFEQALWLDAENAYAHLCLGWTYWAVGQRPEAIREYQKATELDPSSAYYRQVLERAREEMASPPPGEDVDNQ